MFLATIPSILYIDRIGRRPALAVGALCMGLCHFIIAIIFAKNENQWPTHKAAGWAAIAMVWLFVAHFGWSWGPCAWIVVAEVWPLSARPYGIALGASSNWMNNFIVGQVTPDMITGIKYGTFVLFGVLITIGAAFIWFFVPEVCLTLPHRSKPWLTNMTRPRDLHLRRWISSLARVVLQSPTRSAWM